MNCLDILFALSLILTLSKASCQAWEEEEPGDFRFQEQGPWIEDTRAPVPRSLNQRSKSEESSEVPMREMYKDPPIRPIQYVPMRILSGRPLRLLERLKKKRYMGMEIPEYIVNPGDNPGEVGGDPPLVVKNKMVNNG